MCARVVMRDDTVHLRRVVLRCGGPVTARRGMVVVVMHRTLQAVSMGRHQVMGVEHLHSGRVMGGTVGMFMHAWVHVVYT